MAHRVVEDAVEYRNSPFTLVFTVNMGMEESKVVCAMLGNAARALVNSIKKNDIITMEGDFVSGDRVGIDHPSILAVERILMKEHAALGRNFSMYA